MVMNLNINNNKIRGFLKFVKIREFQNILKFIKFSFSKYAHMQF